MDEKKIIIEKQNLLPIQARSREIARVLHHSIVLKNSERPPEEILNMVSEHGFEYTLDYARAHSYVSSWKRIYEKLLSITHLIRDESTEFMETWLRVCADSDDVLLRLHLQERPFLRRIWSTGCGQILLQLELTQLLYYAISPTKIAIANKDQIQIFDRHTGRHKENLLCSRITAIELVNEQLFVGSSDGLFIQKKEGLVRAANPSIVAMSSYAGWVGWIDAQGHFSVEGEELSYEGIKDCTCLVFCHRGLAVALGTEKGSVLLVREEQKVQVLDVTSCSITALLWQDNKEKKHHQH